MLNDHPRFLHHDAIYHQLQYLLLHLEGRLLKRPTHTGTKCFNPFKQAHLIFPVGPLLLKLPQPLPQHPPLFFYTPAPLRQFGDLNHFRLIRVDEAADLPIEPSELAFDAFALLVGFHVHGRIAPTLLVLCL